MDRTALKQYIQEQYGAEADYPWALYPNYEVFRHEGSGKWFAVIMDVPQNRLGLQGTEPLDVVNLKCDPTLVGSLLREPGFFPAYHMSKTTWITAALDGSVPEDKLKLLVEWSYQAIAAKARPKKDGPKPVD